jgi:hypothetical protein
MKSKECSSHAARVRYSVVPCARKYRISGRKGMHARVSLRNEKKQVFCSRAALPLPDLVHSPLFLGCGLQSYRNPYCYSKDCNLQPRGAVYCKARSVPIGLVGTNCRHNWVGTTAAVQAHLLHGDSGPRMLAKPPVWQCAHDQARHAAAAAARDAGSGSEC